MERTVAERRRRRQRAALRTETADDGVATRAALRATGLSRNDIDGEIRAGRWARGGRHTVVIGPRSERSALWTAVWESGSGAILDGVSALLAEGLLGFRASVIDVSVPASSLAHRVAGVRLHRPERMPPSSGPTGLPRADPSFAVVRAALWAQSDRQAALLLCLAMQQRMVRGVDVLDAWLVTRRTARGERQVGRVASLNVIVRDVCDGAHSLGELDFGVLCEQFGLPRPERQALRVDPGGRVYLDVRFPGSPLIVEIDGVHHAQGLQWVADALRDNEAVLVQDRALRIPVLGLRLEPAAFMGQVARGLGMGVERQAS